MLTVKSKLNTNILLENKGVNYLKIYSDAIITNVLNPKVALFFIAFLPQFIDSAVRNTIVPFLMLGITFITTGMIWCLLLATFAAAIFAKMKNNQKVATYINKICGTALILLGIKVALTNRK